MNRIPVTPELLTWARERAGLDTLALAGRKTATFYEAARELGVMR